MLSSTTDKAAARPRRLAGAILVSGAALSILAACASRGGPIPYDVTLKAPDAPKAEPLEADYRIAPLDKVRVTVFQVPDLSGEFNVDLTGHIGLPLIGNVRAVGLTPTELGEALERQYSERYLRNPDVSVGVLESSRRTVTVDGSVRMPGMFPVNGRMTLMQAVALAHGTDETANPRRIAVFREIDGQRMAAAFDLTSIRRGQAEDPRIYAGDIIVVDGSRLRAIQRDLMNTIPLLSTFRPY